MAHGQSSWVELSPRDSLSGGIIGSLMQMHSLVSDCWAVVHYVDQPTVGEIAINLSLRI